MPDPEKRTAPSFDILRGSVGNVLTVSSIKNSGDIINSSILKAAKKIQETNSNSKL